MLLEAVLSKFAAAGLATKAAAGGVAVVVAASAAGAADALPEQAQNGFDQIVSVDAQVEPAADVEDIDDADENSAFGRSVAENATGEAEGDEPGVDGCEVARAASGRALEDCGDDTADTAGTAVTDEDGESDAMEGFGERVSQDATGQDGSEPGVDGEQISQEARDANPGERAHDANRPSDDS